MLRIPRNQSRAGQRGTALIEFALVLPILIVLTFMVVDLSRAFMAKNLLEQSAREGARILAAKPEFNYARSRVKSVAATAGFDSTKVTVTLVNGLARGDPVSATVTANFTWLYPGILKFLGITGSDTVTLTGACTMYREYN